MKTEIISKLIWDDNTNIEHVYKVVSAAFVHLPSKGDWKSHIAITDEGRDGYDATLWCFNQGMSITNGYFCYSAEDAKRKAEKWWHDFVSAFLINPPVPVSPQ